MSFDIRLPIGLLFLAIGALLAGLGLTADAASLRTADLGVNIDLAWGGVLAVFGGVLIVITVLSKSSAKP